LVERAAEGGHTDRYAGPIEAMLDRLLAIGRHFDGFWLNQAGGIESGYHLVNDNWGYVTAAYITYAVGLPEGDRRRERYLDAARRVQSASVHYRGADWEQGRMDGWADTIESQLMMLAFFENQAAADWADDEVGHLFAYQRPDGFVTRGYLD